MKSIKQPAHDTDLDFQLRLLSEEQERSKAEYWELQKAAEWSPCQQFVLSLSEEEKERYSVICDKCLNTGGLGAEEGGLLLCCAGSIGVFARSGGLAAREQLSCRSQRNLAKILSPCAKAVLGANPGTTCSKLATRADWLCTCTALRCRTSVEASALDGV